MLRIDYEFSSVSGEEVREHMKKKSGGSPGIKSQVGTLVSRDFRDAVSIVPAFKKMDDAAKGLLNRMSSRFQETLSSKLRRPTVIKEVRRAPGLEHKLITAQIRRVYHSPEKIMSHLNYKPMLDYRQGMNTTQKWLEFANLIPSSNPIHSR